MSQTIKGVAKIQLYAQQASKKGAIGVQNPCSDKKLGRQEKGKADKRRKQVRPEGKKEGKTEEKKERRRKPAKKRCKSKGSEGRSEKGRHSGGTVGV